MGQRRGDTVASSRAGATYIRSMYTSFTKAERKVADALTASEGEVIYDSITDLAARAGVGETSVLRFCRHLGYRGFQDFKVALARETARSGGSSAEREDESRGIYERVTEQSARLLTETLSLLDEADLDESVEAIRGARNTVFFGVGSSGVMAEQAKYRFLRLGIAVEAVSDAHLAPVRATALGAEDLALFVTVSGSTVDTVETARLARGRGTRIICITSHARSPVTRFADIVLLSASQEGPTDGSSLSAQLAQMHVLNLLFESLLARMGEKGTGNLERSAESVSEKLY